MDGHAEAKAEELDPALQILLIYGDTHMFVANKPLPLDHRVAHRCDSLPTTGQFHRHPRFRDFRKRMQDPEQIKSR